MSKYQRTKEQCFTVWGEYESKRNLRPKHRFSGYQLRRINADRLAALISLCNIKATKSERYFLRSVYGSKY